MSSTVCEKEPLISVKTEKAQNIRMENDDEDEFTYKEFEQGVWPVQEKHYTSWNVANIWVLRGTSMDLIFDTGIGLWNLPAFFRSKELVSSSGEKPFLAVVSHLHFDHSGGLHQVSEFGIHEAEAPAIMSGDSYEAVCFMSPGECSKLPRPGWKRHDYALKAAQPTRILKTVMSSIWGKAITGIAFARSFPWQHCVVG